MKTRIIAASIALALFAAGIVIGARFSTHDAVPAQQAGERKVLFYRNPMNPNITSPTPAKDEMGMDYIPVFEGGEASVQGAGVRIAPEVVNNLGVRTASVEHGELARRIDTVGYVAYDEERLSHVHLRAEGWIEELAVRAVGAPVTRDQLLFRLFAPDLVNAQEEFLQALGTGERRFIAASRERLLALGIDESTVREVERKRRPVRNVPVYAHGDGVVAELNVREGMYVGLETESMTLADLASVWVMVDVFEAQADWVEEGQKAEVRLAFLPGRTFEGRVEYVYPDLDPQTRTLRVRLRFDNPEGLLKPNMYASASILAASRTALSIPREALIRTEREARVIVAEPEGRFRAVAVTPGIETGDRVEIVHGLEQGQRVVSSAQFLIDSEASLTAAMQRMSAVSAPAVQAAGVVNAVDPAARKVNVTHEPIAALGWPAMTMDFEVDPSVDLASIAPGTRIAFGLRQENGAYHIVELRPTAPAAREFQGEGTLNALDVKAGTANISHGAMPALGWPPMTMDFTLAKDAHVAQTAPGDAVRFTLRQIDAVTYELTHLEKADGGTP